MTDFVDPNVIAQITAAKDELVAEVNKISSNSDVIEQYADSLPSPLVGEAPVDGEVYGRKDKDWVKVSSSGGEAVWGGIQGTLADQTDLQAVLDTKVEDGDLADVATSGKYNDLIGAPTVLPEAPLDGKQYVRKDAAWAESELPPLVDTVVTGSFTQQESTSPSAIKAQWFTPSSSKYGFHFQGAAWGGDKYKFLTDKDGVYHQEDGYAERRLAFLDEIVSGGGDTNLGIINGEDNVIVTSSTGDNAIIPHVSTTSNTGDWGGRGNAGVMSVADKQKLDSLGAFDGELDEPLRLNGDAANYTMVEGADTTASGYTTAIKGYGAANPFSSTTLQYTTNIKVDGVYHTDNSNSGSERRLAFIDEVDSGSSGIEEAPEDGKQYARQDATWTEVVSEGGGSPTMVRFDQTPSFFNLPTANANMTIADMVSLGLSPVTKKHAVIQPSVSKTQERTKIPSQKPIAEWEANGYSLGDTISWLTEYRGSGSSNNFLRISKIGGFGSALGSSDEVDFTKLYDRNGQSIGASTVSYITIIMTLLEDNSGNASWHLDSVTGNVVS